MEISVLLVDDDSEYAESLQKFALEDNIRVLHARSLVEMKEFLPKIISGISVIILDIKGMITPNDEFDNDNFLAQAISYLDKEYYTKPRIILTGDVEGFKYVEKYRKSERVFRKGNSSEKEMFNYIKEVCANLDEIVIMKEYEDVFDVFEKNLLDNSRKEELIDIIINLNSNESAIIKNSLGRIRDIQEDIFAKINEMNKVILPDCSALNRNGEISFRKCHSYFTNKAARLEYDFPLFIKDAVIATYTIGCEYGVHTTNTTSNSILKPSTYTVRNSLYSLFDFIKWFKTVV